MMSVITFMLIMFTVAVTLALKWMKQLKAYRRRRERYEQRKPGNTELDQSQATEYDAYNMPVFYNVYVNTACHQNNVSPYDSLPN